MKMSIIYRQFYQQLLGYVRRKVRSKEDADDILQNVFIRISSSVENLSDEKKMKAWIFAITRNAVIDYYRMRAHRTKSAVMENATGDVIDSPDSDPTQGLVQCVASMIELLPIQYRDVITASEIDGIPQKALAEIYGVPYPSMRSRIQRGRHRLKKILYACCHIDSDNRGNILEIRLNQGCGKSCYSCNV